MTATSPVSAEHATGVTNLAFDLVSLLHNKLEAVAAMEIYKRDAELAGYSHVREFIAECQEADRKAIRHLRALVAHQLVIDLEGEGDPAAVAAERQPQEFPEPKEQEIVQSASEDSFPASDPPAYNIGRDHITEGDR
jgi:hypothetical protein